MLCVLAMELEVNCSASYDSASGILTITCVTLQPGQTITSVTYSVNEGAFLTGRTNAAVFLSLTNFLVLKFVPTYNFQLLKHHDKCIVIAVHAIIPIQHYSLILFMSHVFPSCACKELYRS